MWKLKVSNVVLVCIAIWFVEGMDGRPLLLSSQSRPRVDDTAPFARWLVSQSSWGVLNTIADDKGGTPFGNVASFSDGPPGKGSGIPYFYLTQLDPTARYGLNDQRASFTVSEYPIGTCGKTDPEEPTCSKITLIGKLKLLSGNSEEFEFAENALFTKHPVMRGWPEDHNFQIFKLEIEDFFLINWYGGPKPLTVDQYLRSKRTANHNPFIIDLTILNNESWKNSKSCVMCVYTFICVVCGSSTMDLDCQASLYPRT